MMAAMQVANVARLDAGQQPAVLALSAKAQDVDHVAPLSEHVLLAARDDHTAGAPANWPHFLSYAGRSGPDPGHASSEAHLAGYAHLERGAAGEAATAEVVVDPADRRRGIGTALIRALEAALAPGPEVLLPPTEVLLPANEVLLPANEVLQIWSHGHLDAARALAAREGYSIVRELWTMRRALRPGDSSVTLPKGFTSRSFVVGQDEEAWLRVNARAFAGHPEQGRMTRHDLDLRIAEPWFDAGGFILIEDTRGATPVLAASHWTKIAPAADPSKIPTQGEVYVVGVDPAYQGVGLGRAVTVLGLAHLRERGLAQAMLYVDADNRAAVATYSRLGFTHVAVDVMYSHAVNLPVPR